MNNSEIKANFIQVKTFINQKNITATHIKDCLEILDYANYLGVDISIKKDKLVMNAKKLKPQKDDFIQDFLKGFAKPR